MKIADLKRRVEFQSRARIDDGGGGTPLVWQTVYTMSANAIHSGGNESVRYGRTLAMATWIITVRYSPELVIDTNMQILHAGRKLSISSIINVDDKCEWLRINCEEVR